MLPHKVKTHYMHCRLVGKAPYPLSCCQWVPYLPLLLLLEMYELLSRGKISEISLPRPLNFQGNPLPRLYFWKPMWHIGPTHQKKLSTPPRAHPSLLQGCVWASQKKKYSPPSRPPPPPSAPGNFEKIKSLIFKK